MQDRNMDRQMYNVVRVMGTDDADAFMDKYRLGGEKEKIFEKKDEKEKEK